MVSKMMSDSGYFKTFGGEGGVEGTISPDYICLNMEIKDRA
jgi:hypothetical protein